MIRPSSRHAVIGVIRARRTYTREEDTPSYVGFAGHAITIVITEGERTDSSWKRRLSAFGHWKLYGAYLFLLFRTPFGRQGYTMELE
jgi:hypothetical protein